MGAAFAPSFELHVTGLATACPAVGHERGMGLRGCCLRVNWKTNGMMGPSGKPTTLQAPPLRGGGVLGSMWSSSQGGSIHLMSATCVASIAWSSRVEFVECETMFLDRRVLHQCECCVPTEVRYDKPPFAKLHIARRVVSHGNLILS